MVYRKQTDHSSDWHFHEGCPLWPQADYVEIHAPVLDEGERICPECAKLESPIHDHFGSKYFLQGLVYSLRPKADK